MGPTSWLTKSVSWMGHLDLNNRGGQDCLLGLSLDSSDLVAKQGVISGSVALGDVHLNISRKKAEATTPQHGICLSVKKSETRLELMDTTMFVGRCNGLDVELKDDWRREGDRNALERCLLHLIGSISWTDMQVQLCITPRI